MKAPTPPPGRTRPARRLPPRPVGTALALVLALAASAPGVHAEAGLDARFRLAALGATVGELTWRLVVDAAGITFSAHSATAGLAALVRNVEEIESSTLRWHDGVLRPVHYRYQRTGDKRARVVEVALEWSEGVARGTGPAGPWEVPLTPGTFDELCYVLAVIDGLRAGKQQLSVPVVDGGTVESLQFQVRDHPRLDTRLGPLETVRVERLRDDGRATSYWFAPSLGYLPVRILHEERDGWAVDVLIESLDGGLPEDLGLR